MRLSIGVAVILSSSSAFAVTQLGQAQARELSVALLEDAKVKIGEKKTDLALMECFAVREVVLRKFPRPPEDLTNAIKDTCLPLVNEMNNPVTSAKTALEKYGEQISEMAFLMTVGPLGGGYDGSRKDIERIVAASKMEQQAFELGAAFVAMLPKPNQDEEAAAAGVDVAQLQSRRLELFDLAWGATFARQMIEQTIVPQLVAALKESESAANGTDRFTVQIAEVKAAETVELLKLAAPDAPEVKHGEELLAKIRARIDELFAKEVENERMPADLYKGADRASLEALAKKALLGEYKGVLRIVIKGEGWTTPETVAWWDDRKALHWSRTKSLNDGYAAVETKEKGLRQYRVMPVTFSQSWDWATGKFLPTRVSVGGYGHPIMKKNIGKK